MSLTPEQTASLVVESIPEALMWGLDDVTDHYREHPLSSEQVKVLTDTLRMLSSRPDTEPPIWDTERLLDGIQDWFDVFPARVAAELRKRDQDGGGPQIRAPWEMVLELIYQAEDVRVLADSKGWIWSPMGPPIDTGERPVFSVPEGMDDETALAKMSELAKLRGKEVGGVYAERHAKMLGLTMDYEAVEQAILAHSDVLAASVQELAVQESEQQAQAQAASQRVKQAHNDTERGLLVWEAADAWEKVANTMMDRARTVMQVSAIAEGNTFEEVGWDVVSNQARLDTLRALWNKYKPRPDSEWHKVFHLDYPIRYWRLRCVAADLEESRGLEGEAGFLSTLSESE